MGKEKKTEDTSKGTDCHHYTPRTVFVQAISSVSLLILCLEGDIEENMYYLNDACDH